MQPTYGAVAALAVTAIYYLWRTYFQVGLLRERTLRRRVAYMLWVMATRPDPDLLAEEGEAAVEYELAHDLGVPGS